MKQNSDMLDILISTTGQSFVVCSSTLLLPCFRYGILDVSGTSTRLHILMLIHDKRGHASEPAYKQNREQVVINDSVTEGYLEPNPKV
jgi:hypothetical protein